jgi:fermentation-respiration switch protein FrsA (DUF1100 family)
MGGQPGGNAPRGDRLRRRLARLGLLLVAGYLLVVVLMSLLENALIFFPSVYPDGDWEPRGIAIEDAWFETEDGSRLHGWFVPAANPRAVVLFAHGNAGNLTHRVDILDALGRGLGASVLVFDYRGYGRSAGRPTVEGILADARAARRWLARRAGVDESQIVLVGESIGGAVMVDLAARDGARGLVLENTFTSLPDVAAYHYPWLPVRLVMRSQLNSLARIRDYHGPLLQFHGDADRIIPFQLGQKLFEAANEPKQLVVIPFGDHNDPRTAKFYEELDRFLGELPPVDAKSGSANLSRKQ